MKKTKDMNLAEILNDIDLIRQEIRFVTINLIRYKRDHEKVLSLAKRLEKVL